MMVITSLQLAWWLFSFLEDITAKVRQVYTLNLTVPPTLTAPSAETHRGRKKTFSFQVHVTQNFSRSSVINLNVLLVFSWKF